MTISVVGTVNAILDSPDMEMLEAVLTSMNATISRNRFQINVITLYLCNWICIYRVVSKKAVTVYKSKLEKNFQMFWKDEA